MTLTDRIEELARLYEAATPGPVRVEYDPDDHHDSTPSPSYYFAHVHAVEGERWREDSTSMKEADAEFIVALRNSFETCLPVLRAAAEYVEYREAMSLERLVAAVEARDETE